MKDGTNDKQDVAQWVFNLSAPDRRHLVGNWISRTFSALGLSRFHLLLGEKCPKRQKLPSPKNAFWCIFDTCAQNSIDLLGVPYPTLVHQGTQPLHNHCPWYPPSGEICTHPSKFWWTFCRGYLNSAVFTPGRGGQPDSQQRVMHPAGTPIGKKNPKFFIFDDFQALQDDSYHMCPFSQNFIFSLTPCWLPPLKSYIYVRLTPPYFD